MDINAACVALLEKTDDELISIARLARVKNPKSLTRFDLIDSIINCL